MPPRLGYNTNGFAHHDLFAAIRLLRELGYESVAITLDHGPLNPFNDDFRPNLVRMARMLESQGMRSVVETGARFLLDPRNKHEPTLISPHEESRRFRGEFLRQCIVAAAELKSDCVSLWSGVKRSEVAEEDAWRWLEDGLDDLLHDAGTKGLRLDSSPSLACSWTAWKASKNCRACFPN